MSNYKTLSDEAIRILNELKNKLESGQLVELPCKKDQAIYYITDELKIVLRYARTFKVMFELGIEVEATNWEYDRRGRSVLNTTIIHSAEFGDRAFLTQESAKARLKELQEGKK